MTDRGCFGCGASYESTGRQSRLTGSGLQGKTKSAQTRAGNCPTITNHECELRMPKLTTATVREAYKSGAAAAV